MHGERAERGSATKHRRLSYELARRSSPDTLEAARDTRPKHRARENSETVKLQELESTTTTRTADACGRCTTAVTSALYAERRAGERWAHLEPEELLLQTPPTCYLPSPPFDVGADTAALAAACRRDRRVSSRRYDCIRDADGESERKNAP